MTLLARDTLSFWLLRGGVPMFFVCFHLVCVFSPELVVDLLRKSFLCAGSPRPKKEATAETKRTAFVP